MRRHKLLRGNMRRDLWSSDTKVFSLDVSDRRIRPKGQLDRLLKIYTKIDIATGAMNFRMQILQGTCRFAATTHWTNQVPLQIQNSRARRVQTCLQHRTRRLRPLFCQSIRPDTRNGEIVGVFKIVDE